MTKPQTPAIRSTTLDLRAIIPASQWDRFLADLIYKPFEQLASAGKLDARTIAIVNTYLEQYGTASIPFSCEALDIPSLHSYQDGLLAKIRWPIIRGKIEITSFLKKFKDQKSYRLGLRNQTIAFSALLGTPLEGLVQEPIYSNHGINILVNPFINGQSLEEKLPFLDPVEKEQKLRYVLHSYFEWKTILDSKKLEVPGLGSPLESMAGLLHATAGDPFLELMKPLCEELSKGGQTPQLHGVIHGDLNLGNIVEADKEWHPHSFYPLDFETLGTGYLEYDIGKLLSKARLTLDERARIVEYCARLQHEHYGHDQPESVRRHWLNFIRHHTNSIGRYLSRTSISPAFKNMAQVAYAKAVRTLERAKAMGFVEPALVESYRGYFEQQRGLSLLSDTELAQLEPRYDPDQKPSFENLAHPPSLDEMVGGPAHAAAKNPQHELSRLKQNLYPSRWIRLSRIILKGAVLTALATGIALGSWRYFQLHTETQQRKQEEAQTFDDGQYKSWFREPYRKVMEAMNTSQAFNKPLHDVYYPAKAPPTTLSRNDPLIPAMAKRFGFEPDFIIRILNVNQFYALNDTERTNPSYEPINFFEPGAEYYTSRFCGNPSYSMKENLEQGLALLASFRTQFRESCTIADPSSDSLLAPLFENAYYLSAFSTLSLAEQFKKGDKPAKLEALVDLHSLKDALIAFYARYRDDAGSSGSADNFRMARTLTFNVLRGIGGDDGGEYLQTQQFAFGEDFDFTAHSPLMRDRIRSMDYHNLEEVKAVIRAKEQERERFSQSRVKPDTSTHGPN